MLGETEPNAMDQLTWSQLVKTYKYIPEEDLKALQDLNATEDQLERTNQACKINTDKELKSYMFPEEFYLGPDRDNEVVESIVVKVIGFSGSGKSAVSNTLVGKEIFEESSSGMPTTHIEKKQTTITMGCTLTVIDTPGSWSITKDRVHNAFYVLVVNLASPRFDLVQLRWLRDLKDGINSPIKNKRCILLLTHARESLKHQDKSILDYLEEIKNEPLYQLMVSDLETWKVMAINNKCLSQYEREEQRKNILKLILRSYTLADFEEESGNPCCCCSFEWFPFFVKGG